MRLPLVICFVMGVLMIVQFLVPHAVSLDLNERVAKGLIIVGAFAFVLGVGSLIRVHGGRLRRRSPDWPYSVVALLAFGVTAAIGIVSGVDLGTPTDWIFQHILTPLEATMFSLLAFFIASAAYRTFRARTPEATVLLAVALVVMLGRVPLGELVYGRMPDVVEWLFQFPASAAKRGIILGVSLGMVATSLRIIVGIERAYLGGE
jgi:rod shape-determining protein MreD